MTKAWTWHRMDLIKCHAVAQTFDLTYFFFLNALNWMMRCTFFFIVKIQIKYFPFRFAEVQMLWIKMGFLEKKKNVVNNCGFVETKWRRNKTFRCTLREFYHQLIKEKKIKTKNKELQHRNSDWQFGGFYTWLTKGSVEGSIWLVESEHLDFRATPLDVEMTPWVS